MSDPKDSRAAAKRFFGAEDGVSAVEFALIMPIMLALYAGTVEISEALSVDRKVTRVASTVADLVSQRSAVTEAEILDIFEASAAILEPYDPSLVRIVVTAVNVTNAGQTVAWSRAHNAIALRAGDSNPSPVPDNIATIGTQTIVASVDYDFTSPFSSTLHSLTGRASYDLGQVFMVRPRAGNAVAIGS
jgi:Flp pilus assembly protein TadG